MTTLADRPKGASGPRTLEQRYAAGPPMPSGRSRLRPRDFGMKDAGLLAATLASSFCTVWIVFNELTLLSGFVGFLICWTFSFFALYWVVNLLVYGRRMAADRLVAAIVMVGALCMFAPLALIVVFLVEKGFRVLSWHLLTATQKGVLEKCVPGFPCTKPGVLHGIVGTLEQIGLAAGMGVPAAILTAVYLNEVGRGRFAKALRVVVTAMSGVPAILAGAFVYAFWVNGFFHEGFSGFAGSMALTVILLPTVTRATEEVLRIVPNDLREASTALAAPEWRTTWSVVLPTARSGLVTAVLLGVAVALGETAPLLLTIFGNTSLNPNPLHGGQSALPLIAYESVRSTQKADIALAYGAALVLFLMIFVIFISARILSSDWLGNKMRNQMNRRMVRAATEGIVAQQAGRQEYS